MSLKRESTSTVSAFQKSSKSSKQFPIRWHLGNIDPRFGLSKEHVDDAVRKAINLWEGESGKRLFVCDKSGGFPVNLVFDSRQIILNTLRSDREALDSLKRSLDSAERNHVDASGRFQREQDQIDSDLAEYKAKLKEYNRQVDFWNASGGAPRDVIQVLDAEKRDLIREQMRLSRVQESVESMRLEANGLIDNYNDVLVRYKQSAQNFKKKYSTPIKQNVGGCLKQGDRTVKISVYAFEDVADLTMILTHEFGHSLGLKHVKGNLAIMSAVEDGDNPAVDLRATYRDQAELRRVLSLYRGIPDLNTKTTSAGSGQSKNPTKKSRVQADPKVTAIYASFIKNQFQSVSDDLALQLADSIIRQSLISNIDARLLMAILLTETAFAELSDQRVQDKVTSIQANLSAFKKGHTESEMICLAIAGYKVGTKAVKDAGGVPDDADLKTFITKVLQKYRDLTAGDK